MRQYFFPKQYSSFWLFFKLNFSKSLMHIILVILKCIFDILVIHTYKRKPSLYSPLRIYVIFWSDHSLQLPYIWNWLQQQVSHCNYMAVIYNFQKNDVITAHEFSKNFPSNFGTIDLVRLISVICCTECVACNNNCAYVAMTQAFTYICMYITHTHTHVHKYAYRK